MPEALYSEVDHLLLGYVCGKIVRLRLKTGR
jgi:hypothetical protein